MSLLRAYYLNGQIFVQVNIKGARTKFLESALVPLFRSSHPEMFRKYAANLQENTHAEVRFQ